jgi:hypothetical protein
MPAERLARRTVALGGRLGICGPVVHHQPVTSPKPTLGTYRGARMHAGSNFVTLRG